MARVRKMIDCGHVMGKVEDNDGQLILTLVSPSTDGEGVEEVTIWDMDGLKNLVIVLAEAIEEFEAAQT